MPDALKAFGAAQTALFIPIAVLDRRMQRTGGGGIVPFELAGTPERARRTMERWGPEGRSAARASLLLDFPFLVAYSGFNVAAVDRLADGSALGPVVKAAQVAAGACDAIENASLLGVLAGHDERLPAVARGFARTKFALLAVVWTYLAIGVTTRLRG